MSSPIKITASLSLAALICAPAAQADDFGKLKRKHDFVSEPLSCGKVVVGDRQSIAGNRSSGELMGVGNAKIIDLRSKDAKPLGYDVSTINAPYKGDGDIFRIYANRKVGLMDACKGVLVSPQFGAINQFSQDGYAIAVTETEYTVLDRSGTELLSTRFRHGIDSAAYDSIRRKGDTFDWTSYNNKIPGSLDGKKWGLFDVSTQKFVAPPTYDEFGFSRSNIESYPKYTVKRNGKQSGLDIETGALLAPFIFTQFKEVKSLNGQQYVIGSDSGVNAKGQAGFTANAYNVTSQSYVLPRGQFYISLKPELSGYDTHSGRWNVLTEVSVLSKGRHVGYSSTQGIFDESSKRFLIKPIDRPTSSLKRAGTSDYYVATDPSTSGSAMFDASTGRRLTGYHKDANYGERLELVTGGRRYPLYLLSNSVRKTFWAYDGNQNLVYNGRGVGDSWAEVKNGVFVLTEREGRQSLRKKPICIDKDYQVLGAAAGCNVNAPFSSAAAPSTTQAPSTKPSSSTLASRPCDHYMYKRKPNVANNARIKVSSTYCGSGGCYDKRNMIDNKRDEGLGAKHSWTNDGSGEKWAVFSWNRPIKGMEQIYFVGTEGYEVGSYTISVETPYGWKMVSSVRNNRENKICHRFPPEDVIAVKIEGVGPAKQSSYFRINEVVIR